VSRTKSPLKRRIIIEAAKNLFLIGNYADVSMAKISQAAEVSKNTLYSHFTDKEALFKAILKAHWEGHLCPKINFNVELDLEPFLTEFANVFMQYLYHPETLALYRMLISESGRFPDLTLEIVTNNKAPILQGVGKYLSLKLSYNEAKATTLAIYFFGMLKEDAFWHVLAGFRNPYKGVELKTHINSVVTNFYKLIG